MNHQPTPVPEGSDALSLRRENLTNRFDLTSREAVNELKPGDRIEVDHLLKVGLKTWHKVTTGTVVGAERRRHGLHYKRHKDDKVFSDLIVLKLADGSLTTVTIDEFTRFKRVD